MHSPPAAILYYRSDRHRIGLRRPCLLLQPIKGVGQRAAPWSAHGCAAAPLWSAKRDKQTLTVGSRQPRPLDPERDSAAQNRQPERIDKRGFQLALFLWDYPSCDPAGVPIYSSTLFGNSGVIR
jgi:hypothetical protein